jgi:hypothetical protein
MSSIKISQLPAKGANLASTDLVEISEFTGTGYISKSITGQEIIDAASGGSGVTDVTASAPLSSSGGTTPDISMPQADAGTDGYLSTTDFINFTNKQEALVSGTNIKTLNGASLLGSGGLSVQPTLVSGTNIKTINGNTLLGSGDLTISGGVTSVTGTSPIVSSGGATPDISINTANTSTTGALTSTDWNTFNNKQAALVSGTNIKTINGNSVLGSGDLTISGGLKGTHAVIQPKTGTAILPVVNGTNTANVGAFNGRLIAYPFIPATSFTSTGVSINIFSAVAGGLGRISMYDDLNGKPNNVIFTTPDLDTSTTGLKTFTISNSFVAGTTYWLCTHFNNATNQATAVTAASMLPVASSNVAATLGYGYYQSVAFTTIPNPFTGTTLLTGSSPLIFIQV